MKKRSWKVRIKQAAEDAGTYKPFFDSVIDTLAGILERRDAAQETFERSGSSILVKHTNKGGSTNLEKNPALCLINELNRDALAYWRDLGLTPKGWKALSDGAMVKSKEEKKELSGLEAALLKLSGG